MSLADTGQEPTNPQIIIGILCCLCFAIAGAIIGFNLGGITAAPMSFFLGIFAFATVLSTGIHSGHWLLAFAQFTGILGILFGAIQGGWLGAIVGYFIGIEIGIIPMFILLYIQALIEQRRQNKMRFIQLDDGVVTIRPIPANGIQDVLGLMNVGISCEKLF